MTTLRTTVGVLILLLASGGASARQIEVRSPLIMRSRPVFSASVVDRVPAGRMLTLLGQSRDGAWVRVKNGHHEGWAPATMVKLPRVIEEHVEPAAGDEPPPLAAAHPLRPEVWVSRSGFHEDRTTMATVRAARADLRSRPAADGAVLGSLARGEQVPVLRRSADGAWCQVEAGGGEVAWVVSQELVAPGAVEGTLVASRDTGEASIERARIAAPEAAAEVAVVHPPAANHRSAFAIGASAGVALLTRRFTSDGTGSLASYQLSTQALSVGAGAAFTRAFGRRFRLGIDAGYAYAGAASVRYHAADGSTPLIGVAVHDAGAGLSAGLHAEVAGGLDFRVRVGGQLTATVLDGNPAVSVPSDRLLGLNVGLALDLPRLAWLGNHPLGLHAFGNALALGQRTENIDEGRDGGSYGGVFGGSATLGLYNHPERGQVQLAVGYSYGFSVTRLNGGSVRNPGGTGAILGASQHLFSAGLAYAY